MDSVVIQKKDDIVMRLIHYFITEKNYTPIVVRGVKDEVWLENDEGPYRIIRINSNYIHNEEQFNMDVFKTKNVMKQIKKKTLSFKMNALNIFLDINEDVKLKEIKDIDSIIINNVTDITANTNDNKIKFNIIINKRKYVLYNFFYIIFNKHENIKIHLSHTHHNMHNNCSTICTKDLSKLRKKMRGNN